MSNRTLILGTVIAVGVVLLAFAFEEASYLQRGYTLSLSFGGLPPAQTHITFPIWLKLAYGLIGLGALSTLILIAMMRRAAVPFAWVTLAYAIYVGYYDSILYGTLGSPASIKSILLLFLLSPFFQFSFY